MRWRAVEGVDMIVCQRKERKDGTNIVVKFDATVKSIWCQTTRNSDSTAEIKTD